MIEFPDLAIVLLTYKRTNEAVATIQGLIKFLGYEKEKRAWYIADDGSPEAHLKSVLNQLESSGEKMLGYHSKRFSPYTGIGWNKGIGMGFQYSDFVLVMEDDWILKEPFDIHPFVEMLVQREDVGLVRLGGLAVGNTVEIVGHNGHHYFRYHKDKQYAYSGNPQIRHARFVKAYGVYSEEKLNPGELELNYDGRIRAQDGPEIWRPSDIPGWGIFAHIGKMIYRDE